MTEIKIIDDKYFGKRLDLVLPLVLQTACLSRNQIRTHILKSHFKVNNKKVKPSLLLKKNDLITYNNQDLLTETLESQLKQEDLDIEVIFEDSNLIVVNKPYGVVTHPGAGNFTGTLVHAFYDKLAKTSEDRPGVVHRLDKDTQGLLVLAKTVQAHKHLSLQFKEKTAQRTYWALCHGRFDLRAGAIKTNLSRNPKNRLKFSSQEQGREAITHYKVLSSDTISLIELSLETGRTHQIRVHLSELGRPVLNDVLYGSIKRKNEIQDSILKGKVKKNTHLALVARKLSFTHPKTSKEMTFSVPWPKEFEEIQSTTHFKLDES